MSVASHQTRDSYIWGILFWEVSLLKQFAAQVFPKSQQSNCNFTMAWTSPLAAVVCWHGPAFHALTPRAEETWRHYKKKSDIFHHVKSKLETSTL